VTSTGEVGSVLRWGRREFGPADLAVMAIVNATPDSFFDRGRTYGTDAALARVAEVVA
jgi:dihydropteroate synthase